MSLFGDPKTARAQAGKTAEAKPGDQTFTAEFESAGQEAAARGPRRKTLIGVGIAVAVGLVVAGCHLPAGSQSAEIQASASSSSRPTVGATAGYNITNQSGTLLVFQSVAGHVAAPLQTGAAWIPGQTLNFELNTGTLGEDNNTGDALFEAYTITTTTVTDAGTVDIHFKQDTASGYGQNDWAYLNPLDTAPLVASSTTSMHGGPIVFDGETWTMDSGDTNVIKSSPSAPQSYSVNTQLWAYDDVDADSLYGSISNASIQSGTPCSLVGTVTTCTLGGIIWNFGPTE